MIQLYEYQTVRFAAKESRFMLFIGDWMNSVCAMSGDKERCLEAGMDNYISKPISIGPLLEAVERCVTAPMHKSPQLA
jgi:DNA-binding response OmpR family regulator